MPRKRGSKLNVQRGERYALIPEEVIESPSYHALPDWARSVFVALACRYHGRNNGDLSLTYEEAQRLGVHARWKLYAGLRLIELTDLAVCTRRGRLERGHKVCSLYAITWRGINQCEGVTFDPGVSACPLPSHAWAKWTKPDDWQSVVTQVCHKARGRKPDDWQKRKTKIPESTRGGLVRAPRGGTECSLSVPPVVVLESGISVPPMVDASKNSALGERNEVGAERSEQAERIPGKPLKARAAPRRKQSGAILERRRA